MRAINRRNPNRSGNRAISRTLPAPVGGWNTRDALDAMSPTDAVILDNWFPTTGKVTIRKGYEDHATGVGVGNVDTLVEYQSAATQKLLACGGGAIYDATSAAAASSLGSGFTRNNWQTANFNGRVFFVNGLDAPQDYNGTTLASTAWSGSGLTIANLIGVNVFKSRLFFWEVNSQDFWYAPVNTITGALTKFPLSRVSQFGGNLVTMGTWTIDGGDGVDDYAVFIMSTGDVIVYQGTDPGDAAAWSLVGIYRIGKPLNIRGILKYGGDLLITTTDDYVSLSAVLKTGSGEPSKLSGAIQEAATQIDSFGWQSVLYRKGSMMLFNVPTASGYQQHVINTTTGAACRFTNIPSRCWAVYNGDLYFGSTNGTIKKFGSSTSDDGTNIDADGATAWNAFGIPQRKRLSAIRPLIDLEGSLTYSIGVGFDFTPPNVTPATAISSDGSFWDEAEWDVAAWSSELVTNAEWRVSKGTGDTLSTRIKVASQQEVSWLRTDYRMEIGTNL
jgi:hypothetical protein